MIPIPVTRLLFGVAFGVLLILVFSRGSDWTRPHGYPKRDLGDLWSEVRHDPWAAAREVQDVFDLTAPLELLDYGVYADGGSTSLSIADCRGETLKVVLANQISREHPGHLYEYVGEPLRWSEAEEVEPGSERERAIAVAILLATLKAQYAHRVAGVLIGRKAD